MLPPLIKLNQDLLKKALQMPAHQGWAKLECDVYASK
jgi:hypothetical protein